MNHAHATIQRAINHMMVSALNCEAIEPSMYIGLSAALGECNPPHMARLMLRHLDASRAATRRIKIIEPLVYVSVLLSASEDEQ